MLSPTFVSACSVSGLAGHKHLPNVRLRRARSDVSIHALDGRDGRLAGDRKRSFAATPDPGVVVGLRVDHRAGREHLPIVSLKRVA